MFLKENHIEIAIKCFENGSKYGFSDSIMELALVYMKGVGVEKDLNKAKYYFKILSNNYNSYIAQYNLGMIYHQEKKYLKSLKYFELSGEQEYSEALMKIGIIYRDGLGVKRNPIKTYQYFEKAAKLNNTNAFFYLGVFNEDGFGTKKNINRTRRYYKLAARYGIEEGLLNLGLYYIGKEQTDLAKYYWGISSNPNAKNNLGILYSKEGNYLEAKKMFEMAGEQGHSNSLVSLGKLYLNGQGVEENFDIGIDYIVQAARLHNPIAIQIIDDILNEFEEYDERRDIVLKKQLCIKQT